MCLALKKLDVPWWEYMGEGIPSQRIKGGREGLWEGVTRLRGNEWDVK